MPQNPVITVPQLFSIFFISRTMISLIYTPIASMQNTVWEFSLAAVISMILTFILVIPVYCNNKSYPYKDIVDIASQLIGKLSVVISLIYAIYYIFVCSYTLSLFNILISSLMNPGISLEVLSIAIVVTSCYGAHKGIESLARTCGIISVIIIISLTFICIALLPKSNVINLYSLSDRPEEVKHSVIFIISRMSCIPGMCMALPFAKGNIKKGIFFWNCSIFLLIIIVTSIVTAALGDYVKTQMFPIYTAASIAEIGILKRLDAVYFGVWTSGIFVKLSFYLYLTSVCISKIFGQKSLKPAIIITGVVISSLSILTAKVRGISAFMYSTNIFFWFTVLTSFIIPLLLLIFSKNKDKNNKHGLISLSSS